MEKIRENIITAYSSHFKSAPVKIEEIKRGVSEKLILRLVGEKNTVVGIYNKYVKETTAFIEFTKSFAARKLKVPDVLHIENNKEIYFITHLGKFTLYDYIKKSPNRKTLMSVYRKVLQDLIDFQFYGRDLIDLQYCYETQFFDRHQISYDINRFYHYFLDKCLCINPIIKKEEVLDLLVPKILDTRLFFMYRDFQPRNIIKQGNNLFYVDYQSGRLGPPQYDLISFLYSGSIDVTQKERKELINYYYAKSHGKLGLDEKNFYENLKYFALLRIMQILGSYCYSGYVKGKKDVMKKIPKAIRNLKTLKFDEPALSRLQKSVIKSYTTRISKHRLG
ncbi:MAG: phosphotransferase [Ignavibacteria bacterium]|nr:phosphotransferase [Ignavibacteria bacterium]